MLVKSSLLLALFSTLTAAQNLTGEPACAVECLRTAIAASICDSNDQGCQCTTAGKASIQSLSTECLLKACSVTDLITAQQVGNDLCVAYSSTAGSSGTATATTGLIPTTGTSVFVAPTTSTELLSVTSMTTSAATTSTTHSVSTTTSVVQSKSTVTSVGAASTTNSSTGGAAMPTAVANFAALVGGLAAMLL